LSGVALEGVRKSFDGVPALAGVDLSVADGELLVVLGPSGSGKTTLLRAVAGLESVDEGRVLIGGRDVTDLAPARRNVSMVFQTYALFPHMTAAENIGFGLVVRDVPKAEARARVAAAAELVGCAALLERRPAQLSGGERQRIALARALVREPDAFLLDEPLSNLDAELRVEMRSELKALHARVGTTMLYVTHDQVEALTLGDRIAVMRDGVVAQAGTPDEIWSAPADRFVARFVGSPAMNMLAAETPLLDRAPPRGGEVEVGVRPEHVRVGGDGVPGVVRLVEPVGSEAYLQVDVQGTIVLARVEAVSRPAAGDTVHLSVRREDVHLFDRQTGSRVEWR
jgi:ABC-type sugar transport system ATPase subunit